MAEKLLKETKDTQTKRKKTKKVAEEDDIYKIDLTLESPENEDDFKAKDLESEEKEEKTKAKRGRKSKNVVKVVEDDEEVDEIFGNINKWINEDEIEENLEKEKTEKKGRKKSLTKVEDGIKSSKTTAKKTTTKKTTTKATTKTRTKNKKTDETESIQTENEQQGEIKIHAENDTTELQLKHNEYKVELQKLEYNVYTQTSDNSYIIVRSPNLRIVSENVYLMIKKQEEDYEITTNQDFKINYVIDNLERKDNVVNFKLTNLVEIIANESGLIFEIDEEKVIENNLEDNHTLVISEEDGKVYLPYTKDEIKKDVSQNKGAKISEIIENKYILPLDKYKNSIRARFREGYNLMYHREGKSKRSAIMLGIELMFETNLHPAIISACKNLEELDIYLDCLDDNELEKFSCFKIIYKSLPTLRKKAKYREI
ncbi:unknown [Clostridium sp. CAG:356]|nr:unknown [Clostridium sp. CAG:356]